MRCPFSKCGFKTNKLSSFSCHRSRTHKSHFVSDFRTSVSVESNLVDLVDTESCADAVEEPFFQTEDVSLFSQIEETAQEDVDWDVLEHKLVPLLLGMQMVLHISKSATQKII